VQTVELALSYDDCTSFHCHATSCFNVLYRPNFRVMEALTNHKVENFACNLPGAALPWSQENQMNLILNFEQQTESAVQC